MRQQRHILFYMPDFYGHLVPLLLGDFMCKTDYIHYGKPLYYLPIFQFMYLLLSVTTVVNLWYQILNFAITTGSRTKSMMFLFNKHFFVVFHFTICPFIEMEFCYQNCSFLLSEKVVLVIEKNFEFRG